jgi:hypothetical protein
MTSLDACRCEIEREQLRPRHQSVLGRCEQRGTSIVHGNSELAA